MFDIGMSHLVVIAIVGILVLGPEKLPGFAREAARTWRAVRTFTSEANRRITAELLPEDTDQSWGDLGDLSDLDPRALWDRAVGDDERKPAARSFTEKSRP